MLPPDTLASLHAAIVASPADRAVRLVYADALEENGDPDDLPRAEFIRSQIALEAMEDDDPRRDGFESRCKELFARHWVDWWGRYCIAARLPSPFVPRVGVGEWLKRAVGFERRVLGDPYARDGFGLGERRDFAPGIEFVGGFPELLSLRSNAAPLPQYAEHLPVCRLVVTDYRNSLEWRFIDGAHLGNLEELVMRDVRDELIADAAASPHLGGLARLSLVLEKPSLVRVATAAPAWARRRVSPFGASVVDRHPDGASVRWRGSAAAGGVVVPIRGRLDHAR